MTVTKGFTVSRDGYKYLQLEEKNGTVAIQKDGKSPYFLSEEEKEALINFLQEAKIIASTTKITYS